MTQEGCTRSAAASAASMHAAAAFFRKGHEKRVCALQGYANEGVRCWSGNDDEAHDGRHSFGSQGVISVTSNLLPGLFSRLMRSPNKELMDSLQELVAWLFCEPNPIGINTAMASASPCNIAARDIGSP